MFGGPVYETCSLFQARCGLDHIEENTRNESLLIRDRVEAHSKEIFNAGEAMSVDKPVDFKQEYVLVFSISIPTPWSFSCPRLWEM